MLMDADGSFCVLQLLLMTGKSSSQFTSAGTPGIVCGGCVGHVDLLIECVEETFSPSMEVTISQSVPTARAQTIPYAYASGLAVNALMSAMPPAITFVETRPSSKAPANSNMDAICRQHETYRSSTPLCQQPATKRGKLGCTIRLYELEADSGGPL